jgi:predicted DNA-binding protein (MmcQ/YjbR family)
MPANPPLTPEGEALRLHALGLPETHEDNPWGHAAIKVRGKVFVFLANQDGGLSLSAKLPESVGPALLLPFASPTRYGLGKAGWVSARFAAGERAPVALLEEWIEESYRAIAPKKLVKQWRERAEPAAGGGTETPALRSKEPEPAAVRNRSDARRKS